VALLGAGPASLACAAELRRRGIAAHVYEARSLPGGLNTYGVAEYKLPLFESLREISMLSQLGIEFHFNVTINSTKLMELENSYDAVFLGVGLGAIHKLGIANESRSGITNALDLIAGYKERTITASPARVAIVGAGNTAIDAAIASVRLGASEVHMIYRRGQENMSAFDFEYEHAKREGVRFHWHVQPTAILGSGTVEGMQLTHLKMEGDGSLVPEPGSEYDLAVDSIVLAIGQSTHTAFLAEIRADDGKIQVERGRIVINRATGQTSNPKYFAGGDCANGGREVVDAVADGKRAGIGIAAWLEGQNVKV
jgi:glutamate synthase (NADPH/NADH) small chain